MLWLVQVIDIEMGCFTASKPQQPFAMPLIGLDRLNEVLSAVTKIFLRGVKEIHCATCSAENRERILEFAR